MKPKICAHRGFTQSLRENTIEAFAAAVEIGADMIEFDVRKTGDGRLIVFHNPTITTGGGEKPIKETSYKRLNEVAAEQGFFIPLLSEALDEFGNKIPLDIEIKETGYELEVAKLASSICESGSFVITSFNDFSIRQVKKYRRKIRTGLLLGSRRKTGAFNRLTEAFPLARILKSGADFVLPNQRLLRLGFAKRMWLIGKPVWAWTINDGETLRKLLKTPNIETVITDHPDIALKTRDAIE